MPNKKEIKIVVRKNRQGERYWLLKAANGEEIAKSSESYKTIGGVRNSLKVVAKAFLPTEEVLREGLVILNEYKGAKKPSFRIKC